MKPTNKHLLLWIILGTVFYAFSIYEFYCERSKPYLIVKTNYIEPLSTGKHKAIVGGEVVFSCIKMTQNSYSSVEPNCYYCRTVPFEKDLVVETGESYSINLHTNEIIETASTSNSYNEIVKWPYIFRHLAWKAFSIYVGLGIFLIVLLQVRSKQSPPTQ